MNGTTPQEGRKRPLSDIENNSEARTPPATASRNSTARKPIRNPYSSTKKSKPKPNDNDDDVMVLSPPPPPRPAQANTTTATTNNKNEDDDVVIEYSNASNPLIDLIHGRPDCGVHSFDDTTTRIQYCEKCYCVVCDKPVKECTEWQTHCQQVKQLSAEPLEDDDIIDDEATNAARTARIDPATVIDPAVQSYYARHTFMQQQAARSRARDAQLLDEDSDEHDFYARMMADTMFDHHYTDEFNHAYNNGGRGRHPKDMRITDVLAQKLEESLQLSEPTASITTRSNESGDTGASRSQQRKKRFDQCKMEGDIPQLGLHKSFFVEGVRIGWPFPSVLTPQRQMAIHLIEALKSSQHVVLESPTGTGKSAAILCSVLAWQRHHAKRNWGKHVGKDPINNNPILQALGAEADDAADKKFPRIIYCSRTHSQVAQMVASLKKTPYRPRMTVLGSRDRLCIHKSIRNKNPSNPDESGQNKSRANVNTACQMRVANTEKMRKSLWKSHDFRYDDNRPPESLPGDGDGNNNVSQDDDDDNYGEDQLHSSEWILKKSTKKLTCSHYRQLTAARTTQMARSNFLVNQDTIDCCKSGGEKTKLGVHDIEDLVSFGLNPYTENVALYRRGNKESFGIDLGGDCTIQGIRDDSPAKFSGQLKKGDKVLKVNGKRVASVASVQREIAKTSSDLLELTVLRSTSPSSPLHSACTSGSGQPSTATELKDVFLYRPVGQKGFGLTLEGDGHDSSGCCVNGVKVGGAAAKHVKEGDVVVSVNGENVEKMSFAEIISKIQATARDPLQLSLRREVSPDAIPVDGETETNEQDDDDDDNGDEELYSAHSACPYYLSRAISKHAELLFAPYNYILDPGIRNALDISLDGAIVVLDEAHNVESTLTESGSGKFGEIELSNLVCMLSLHASAARSQKNMAELEGGEKVDVKEIAHELLLFVENLIVHMQKSRESFERSTGNIGAAKALEEYRKFHTPDNTEFEVSYSGPNGHGVRRQAVGCKPFFDKLKLSSKEASRLLEYARALDTHLSGDKTESSGDGGNEKGTKSWIDTLVGLISKFAMAAETPEHFYVSCVIQANGNLDHAAGEENENDRNRGRFKKKPAMLPFAYPRSPTNPNAALPVCNHPTCKKTHNGANVTPGYGGPGVRHGHWCDGTRIPPWEAHLVLKLLYPGLLMKDLATQCRTVVLASGSISPIQSLCAELDLKDSETSKTGRLQTRPKPLEANHVVNLPKQLFAVAVGIFPDGSPLTVNYNNYKHPEFFPRLGTAIANIIESVPFGGVLIFLPSYSFLRKCTKCWNPYESPGRRRHQYDANDNSSPEIWERFVQSKGKVIVEPTGSQEAFETARDDYAETIKTHGNCILLAVFRGKMSEGISFNNNASRAVICVGLPFPNAKDRGCQAKKMYNEEQRKLKNRTDLLPGGMWYCQEADRAVAQALGRCIRHEGDFGAVVLLDSRHCNDGSPGFVHSKLPKWMRHNVRTLSRGNIGHGQNFIQGSYQGLKREMELFFAQAPEYAESILIKRKKEFEQALEREKQSSSLQYDCKTGWSTSSLAAKREAPQSVGYTGSLKRVTQESPLPPPPFAAMQNEVVDLLSPEDAVSAHKVIPRR